MRKLYLSVLTAVCIWQVTAATSLVKNTSMMLPPPECELITPVAATASTGDANLAIDGNGATRWESAAEDPQTLTVDLGTSTYISAVTIDWEAANAKDYTLSGSVNGTDWVTIGTYTDMPAGARTDVINDINAEYRYLQMHGTARNLTYGYSIWEFHVCSTAITEPEPSDCNPVMATSATATTGDAGLAIDGNDATRWESEQGVDPQVITVDLGESVMISALQIHWETANAKDYTLSGSVNGTDWVTIGTYTDMPVGDRTDMVDDVDAEYQYIMVEGAARNTPYGYSIWEITICGPATEEPEPCTGMDIESATASTGDAAQAIDGIDGTRWESEAGVDPQSLTVDLGAVAEVQTIRIHWETANAKDYTLSGSENGTDWVTIGTYTDMPVGDRTDVIEDIDGNYQYIMMEGTARNTPYGYSIWEFTVCGVPGETEEEYTAIPAFIEAEDYNDMFGVDEEATTDEGGGESVGWIDAGDWMDYNINVPEAGDYKIDFRVASNVDTGMIELFSGETSLGTVAVPNTGGWQVWQTVSTTVTLPAGNQVFRIFADTAGFNINWLEFTEAPTNSLQQFDKQLFTVYPNPAHGTVTIAADKDSDLYIFTMYGTMAGKVNIKAGDNTLSLDNYATGLYLLKMDGKVVKLLIK
ncbi:discoidin domain-containing protein [Flavobacterium rhizosphaerae]|uniref:Discoidin domain-containing protein n=1 Tax=Flavobacterium rhizosphaerae TaxID=3163298 RepID=A0ABW8YV16_9FLAO